MSKKTLYKLFYASPDEYEKEYNIRYNDEDTIHLDIDIGQHKAFICQSADALNTIISIERIDKKINDLTLNKLPGVAVNQFAAHSLIDEIIKTNDIEGVYSTRKEIGDILEDFSAYDKRNRFVGLVNKYMILMNDTEISIKSCEDIRTIYDDIFLEEIKAEDTGNLPDGQFFRKDDVVIQGDDGKVLHQGLVPEVKIISVMEKSLGFLNDERYDPLLRLSVFHYLFGYIHPFYDGNGRTSRFISSYLLSKKLNNLIGYRISYTIKENIKEYYKAFTVCNHHNNMGDLTPFVEMFLNMILKSEIDLLDALTIGEEKLNYYRKVIDSLPNIDYPDMWRLYDVLIQAALFSIRGISRDELMEFMKKSDTTLRKKMERIPENLLVTVTNRKKKYYMLNLQELDKIK